VMPKLLFMERPNYMPRYSSSHLEDKTSLKNETTCDTNM
jgi:hypothetical protein